MKYTAAVAAASAATAAATATVVRSFHMHVINSTLTFSLLLCSAFGHESQR